MSVATRWLRGSVNDAPLVRLHRISRLKTIQRWPCCCPKPIPLVFISNSLPTNEDICSSVIITWSVCYRACAEVLRFTITNDPPKRMSCLVRYVVEEFCQLCGKKMEKVKRKRKTDRDFYVVEVVEVDTTRKQLKIHFVGFSHELR